MRNKNLRIPWHGDNIFKKLLDAIHGKTLMGPNKCWTIYCMAKAAKQIGGKMAEVGVFKGGGAKIITTVAPKKKLLLFDTFEGLPETNRNKDAKMVEGQFFAPEEIAKKLLAKDNVEFHKGYFPDTAKTVGGLFSFVHIDGDLYQTTKDAANFFHPKMTEGGFMVFDDYGNINTPGVKQALDEYMKNKRPFLTLETGQAIVFC